MTLPNALRQLCRTCNPPNGLGPTGLRLTSTVAGISAAGLVLASAGFGALYAWGAGSAHGWLMASLTVLFAVALEVCKPLSVAAAFNAFKRFALVRGVALALLAVVSIAYSLTADCH